MPGQGAALLAQLGAQAASGGLGGLMDMVFQPFRNQNQLRQNQKLINQQVEAQQKMGLFNVERQIDLWNRTNAGAQIEHYKKAGLNPALMYEGAGAGGSTAAVPGSVSQGGADPRAGGGYTGMNILMPAQVELMRAQARNLDADTAKKSGVDTQLGLTSIENLKAHTTNVKAQTTLTKIQTGLAEIQKQIAETSQEDVTDIISLNAQKIQQEVFQVKNQTDISDATKNTIIKTVQQQYINSVLQGMAIKSGIQLNQAQINKMSADILQGWKGLSIEEKKAKIQEYMATEQKDDDQWIQVINGVFDTVVDGWILKGILGAGKRQAVKGFVR